MHPTLSRLLSHALRISEKWPERKRIHDVGDLVEHLQISHQVLTNWKERGVSKDGALKGESVLGCPAVWTLYGVLPAHDIPANWIDGQHLHEGSASLLLQESQQVRLAAASDIPLIAWEVLMSTALPNTFRLKLQDASLAPDLLPGDELVFQLGLTPAPGDLVLLKDPAGQFLVRELRQGLPGVFEAAAINPAFKAIAFADSGLEIAAVCTEEIRKRRRSGAQPTPHL